MGLPRERTHSANRRNQSSEAPSKIAMLKTTGPTVTTPTIIPVSMFFTLAPENKRERVVAATMGVTVCEVSQAQRL